MRCLVLACLLASTASLAAPSLAAAPPSKVQAGSDEYSAFRELTRNVHAYRRQRLIDWNTFLAAATEPGVLILDARSPRQFAAGHLAGAVNLPLTDFTAERLAEVIGRPDRPILIYCNNNFLNDRPPVMSKAGPVALNNETFTHLVGFGYLNVRELRPLLDIDDPRIPWVSSAEEARISSPPTARAR